MFYGEHVLNVSANASPAVIETSRSHKLTSSIIPGALKPATSVL